MLTNLTGVNMIIESDVIVPFKLKDGGKMHLETQRL